MSDFSVTLSPGYTFTDGEVITAAKLNSLGDPAINLAGTVTSASIADGTITAAKLATDSVIASKILNLNVTTDKLADNAVTTAKILDSNVTTAKILDSNVTTAKIADLNVTNGKIADATIAAAKMAVGVLTAPALGSNRNLVVKINTGTPNSKLDVTADELVLKASALGYLASTVSKTADITVSGVNGLDTGAEASSTWYYLFVIYDGTTVSSLLSTSKTAPTMPGSYTYKVLVGAVFNNGSSNFSHVITYGAVTKFVGGEQSFSPGTAATSAHNFGAVPDEVQWMLRCTDAGGEAGYAQNDEILVSALYGSGRVVIATEGKNATNLYVVVDNQTVFVNTKSTGAFAAITNSKWKLVAYATYA